MKRTKEKGTVRWVKTGGGSFAATIAGRRMMIKPGQEFSAKPEEIPTAFRDVVVPVDNTELAEVEASADSVDVTKLTYTIEPRGGGYYNVLDSEGKIINEKALRKGAAEELISSLK